MNKTWLSGTSVPDGMLRASAYTERESAVMLQIQSLAQSDTDSTSSAEAKALKSLYELLLDSDSRNALGIAPLLSQLRSIERIYTLDDLTRYLVSGAWTLPPDDTRAAQYADWLLCPLASAAIGAGAQRASQGCVRLYPPALFLGDPAEYSSVTKWGSAAKTADSTYLAALFAYAGCTQQNASERYQAMMAFEANLAACCLTYKQRDSLEHEASGAVSMSIADLASASATFPMAAMLSASGISADIPVLVIEPGWLAGMQDLYTSDSIDGIKAMLQARLLAEYAPYLDQACVDLRTAWLESRFGIKGTLEANTLCARQASQLLGPIAGRAWCENSLDSDAVLEASNLAEKLRLRMKATVDTTPWLSDKASAVAAEKIEAMTMRIGMPDAWPDCSALSLPSAQSNASSEDGSTTSGDASADASTEQAGISPIDAIRAIRKFRQQLSVAKASSPDSKSWSIAPQSLACTYCPSDNSLTVCGGLLGGSFMNPFGSDESHAGGLGAIMAAEMSHAFDLVGRHFGATGEALEWWTDDDLAAYCELEEQLASYCTSTGYMAGVSGQPAEGWRIARKAAPVIAGLSCACEMLQVQSSKKDGPSTSSYSDFFSAFANCSRIVEGEDVYGRLLDVDGALPGYLRTNLCVQQIDAFFEVCDAAEGDAMYLGEESRMTIW